VNPMCPRFLPRQTPLAVLASLCLLLGVAAIGHAGNGSHEAAAMIELAASGAAATAFSPDGKILAVATSQGVERYRLDGEIAALPHLAAGEPVSCVAFSPDGMLLAWATRRNVVVWHRALTQTVRVLSGHTGRVTTVSFSADGTALLSSSEDGTVLLWDTWTGRVKTTINGHARAVLGAAFSPDGTLVASASFQEVALWDAVTGEAVLRLDGHETWVEAVAFSPDGKHVATCSLEGAVIVWEVDSGREAARLSMPERVGSSLAYSLCGRLLMGGSHRAVPVWYAGAEERATVLRGHDHLVTCLAFSPDGRTAASVSWDGTARLWDLTPWLEARTLHGHEASVNAVVFSPDGRLIASASADWTVRIWSTDTAAHLRTLEGHSGTVNSAVFSPDGRLIASASTDRTVRIWSADTGAHLRTLEGHTSAVYAVAFSPDGQLVASGGRVLDIGLWNPATGEQVQTLEGHTRLNRSLSFSPDGRFLASGSWDTTVRLWDVAEGHTALILRGHTRAVNSVAFSRDGRQLVSGSGDNSVLLWGSTTGDLLHRLTGHTGDVLSVALSSDGLVVASGSQDRTIRLWDLERISDPALVTSFRWGAVDEVGGWLLAQPWSGGRVRFDATDGLTANEQIVKYEWDWESDGEFDDQTRRPVIERSFAVPGVHHVTLRVTNSRGATSEITRPINVAEPAHPEAEFTFTPVSPTRVDVVRFADESSSPRGDLLRWHWEFGDGNTSTLQNPTHRYTRKGTFTVRLTVTDDDGATDTTTRTITVVNLPPVASFTVALHIEHLGLLLRRREVTFDASGSYDPDGEIVRYAWDFGDGNTAEGRIVTHTYPEAGTYTVRLTVTDDDGMTDTTEQEVHVVPGGGGGPP